MHPIAHHQNFCVHTFYVLKQFLYSLYATGNYGNLEITYKDKYQNKVHNCQSKEKL
jgi:hypothetical protein